MALTNMKRERLVENPSQGYWLIPSTTQEDDGVDSEPNNLDLEPEKIIGSGKQSVLLPAKLKRGTKTISGISSEQTLYFTRKSGLGVCQILQITRKENNYVHRDR